LTDYFKKIIYPIHTRDIKKLIVIFILTILTAIFELLGIGIIIPILNIFAGNNFLQYTNYFNFLADVRKEKILGFLLILLIFVYFFKFFLLKTLIYMQNDFSHRLFTDISRKIFKNYLYENFAFHLKKNSSELIRNTQGESNLFSFGIIFPLVRLLSETLIFLSICILLIIYDWQASAITIVLMSSVGFILLKFTNEKLKTWGKKRQFHSNLVLKQLQQSFSSIKEIILNNLENIFLDKFHYHNLENAIAGRNRDTTVQLPRLILELVGVTTFIILTIFLLNTGKTISETFITIGVFFFAATRLLPSISKIAQSVQTIKFNAVVVDLIYSELKDFENNKNNRKYKTPQKNNFEFKNINFENVSFSYFKSDIKILNDINIEIIKGDKIGIVGKTGSGKSTFLNLLCGLLEHSQGKIKINTNSDLKESLASWQRKIAYVPQGVSILDESILFNIALENDLNKVNIEKINEILKTVDLYDYIYSLPRNIYELAGENGKNFSGGQCQRIGIARALYKNVEIIVLDEATSALDEITETKILEKIFEKKAFTVVTISHRKNSIKNCNKIFEIQDKTIRLKNLDD
jgi:ATP-binding cassette, subfamily B, bacterial PglK